MPLNVLLLRRLYVLKAFIHIHRTVIDLIGRGFAPLRVVNSRRRLQYGLRFDYFTCASFLHKTVNQLVKGILYVYFFRKRSAH